MLPDGCCHDQEEAFFVVDFVQGINGFRGMLKALNIKVRVSIYHAMRVLLLLKEHPSEEI
jgi:hypothetical protein